MEFGLYTLGDLAPDLMTGARPAPAARLAEILAAARLAEQGGLDLFGVGEHHRLDFVVSSPAVVLAAIAGQTRRLRLFSAVTVLSALDPVRLFEDFATLDVLSQGRAEIIAGRGVFTEPFPLFGCDLDDYDALFAEKLDLLLRLNREPRINWRGRFRAALTDAEIAPRPVQAALPVSIAVGGTPASAERAGRLGLPLTFVMLGAPFHQGVPLVQRYRQAGQAAGHDRAALPVTMAVHLHLARDSQTARDRFQPYHSHYWRHFSPRGGGAAISRAQFDAMIDGGGSLVVGSPQQAIDQILRCHQLFGNQRLLAQVDIGGQPYAQVAETIELLAGEVMPAVRRALAGGDAA